MRPTRLRRPYYTQAATLAPPRYIDRSSLCISTVRTNVRSSSSSGGGGGGGGAWLANLYGSTAGRHALQ